MTLLACHYKFASRRSSADGVINRRIKYQLVGPGRPSTIKYFGPRDWESSITQFKGLIFQPSPTFYRPSRHLYRDPPPYGQQESPLTHTEPSCSGANFQLHALIGADQYETTTSTTTPASNEHLGDLTPSRQ